MKKITLVFLKNLPAPQKRITVSTLFTLARIVLTPCIVGAMVLHAWGVSFILFLTAALTDLLDGLVARVFDQKTFLGACLDPIADKILLLSCFSTLAFVRTPLFTIPVWFVAIVLIRELIIIVGSYSLFAYRGYIEIRPTLLGKATTAVQIMVILWLFACYFFHWLPIKTYYTVLGTVVLMVGASLYQYLVIGMNYWRHHEKK